MQTLYRSPDCCSSTVWTMPVSLSVLIVWIGGRLAKVYEYDRVVHVSAIRTTLSDVILGQ